ncbi:MULTISPECIES: 1-acyl-sn-glycerol-3-phosphate acyltransferase [Pseudomonas]|uniref:1-acyl-sn-glycerol-3-phosphate acyltransferase n=1 Tax=Pseudomonas wuhanensis TaxID=2954098 RepID=A0ABY9H146_9PSED|nr:MULTISPECIES: lysophospholipid acyltransferase family protein [unclassified Pseudomonas]WLI15336.1 lysophospholipid acyltransferase family protein [Pseudomonas sp. FP603]WLI21010.1 lysophospholipid acyltransferase family protein [Pseudomonas sp. FP607]
MILFVRWLLVVLFIVLSFPFLCLFMLVNPSKNKNLHVACRSYTVINKIFSVRVAVSGFDTISTAQPYIYVANHQCNYDVLIVAEALKPGTVIVGKKSLKWLPLVGQLYWLTGSLFIDRNSPRASIQSLRKISKSVVGDNTSLWIFPEGTRNKGGEMLPFKSGAFRVAKDMGVGIVPVTISPAVGDVAYNSLRSTEVSIVAHQPIEADVVANMSTKELASYTREIINNGLPII